MGKFWFHLNSWWWWRWVRSYPLFNIFDTRGWSGKFYEFAGWWSKNLYWVIARGWYHQTYFPLNIMSKIISVGDGPDFLLGVVQKVEVRHLHHKVFKWNSPYWTTRTVHLRQTSIELKRIYCIPDAIIKSVAVCAGSGASVLHGVCADLYVSGEMSHHEVLDAVQRGRHVILCDHSNTERGFLAELKVTLTELFEGKVTVIQSQVDKDPLEIVWWKVFQLIIQYVALRTLPFSVEVRHPLPAYYFLWPLCQKTYNPEKAHTFLYVS